MLAFFLDVFLFLAMILWLMKLLWDYFVKKDPTLWIYLGFRLPKKRPPSDVRPCFLFYAVSMGETKAAKALYDEMKKNLPNACFYVASRTKTGHVEAQKNLLGAEGYFLLPFDFSWNGKKIMKRLRPTALIIIESDLWFNLIYQARKSGALVFLASARISEQSFRRFLAVPFFSKRLFSSFTAIFAQNSLFQERFILLGAKKESVFVTGNLKWSTKNVVCEDQNLLAKLKIAPEDFVIVIGSTHEGEEALIVQELNALGKEFPNMKLVFVPRHPYRFSSVIGFFKKQGIPFLQFSKPQDEDFSSKIIVVDEMGLLCSLYQRADLAIVAGSFTPSLKGHNILEPIQMGSPVLFGPYMADQKDLKEAVLAAKAGCQVSLQELQSEVKRCLSDRNYLNEWKEKGKVFLQKTERSSVFTWETMRPFFSIKH